MTDSNNDLMSEMAGDAKPDANLPESTKLKELSTLVQELVRKDKIIAEQEDVLKNLQAEQRELSMNLIPDLFDELGLSQLKTEDGQVVDVKREFAASITAANKPFCLDWLRKNGHESIIKHDVTVKFKKGEEDENKRLIAGLKSMGLTYTDKEHVHPMTLKAFVKEQIEGGADLPQEPFGVFPVRKTKIK